MNFNLKQKQSHPFFIKNPAIFFLLSALLLSGCGPKPFLWKGNYISINTTEQPKEDFKAGDYIIVSYADSTPNAKIPYKFGIIKENKQVALVLLKHYSKIIPKMVPGTECRVTITPEHFALEGIKNRASCIKDKEYIPFFPSYEKHLVYKLYRKMPNYETLKNDIMKLLPNIFLNEYYPHITIDTVTEKPKENFKVGNYNVIAYAPVEHLQNLDILYKFSLFAGNEESGIIFLQNESSDFEAPYLLKKINLKHKDTITIVSDSASLNHATYKEYKTRPDYETLKNDVISVLSK